MFTIVTQTRGDAQRLEEWVRFHARLGFNDFQFILDGVIDDTEDVLRSIDLPIKIDLHHFAEEGEYYDGLTAAERQRRVTAWRERHQDFLATAPRGIVDSLSLRQFERMPSLMAPYAAGERGRGWLAFIDVDEFINIPSGSSIGEFARGLQVPRIRFRNFNVDTSDHDPSRPVLEQHAMRWSFEDVAGHESPGWRNRAKTMVRYRFCLPFTSVHRISKGRHAVADPAVARLHHFRTPVQPMNPEIPYSVHDPLPPVELSPKPAPNTAAATSATPSRAADDSRSGRLRRWLPGSR